MKKSEYTTAFRIPEHFCTEFTTQMCHFDKYTLIKWPISRDYYPILSGVRCEIYDDFFMKSTENNIRRLQRVDIENKEALEALKQIKSEKAFILNFNRHLF